MLVKLINTSISASWLILAIIILRFSFKNIPKSMRCALWGLVAVRLLLPFSIHSSLSLIPSAEIIPENILYMDVTAVPQETAQDIAVNPILPGSAETPKNTASLFWKFDTYGTAVWLTGMTLIIAYALISYLRLRRIVSASLRLKGNIWICDQIDSPFILGLIRPRIYLPSSMERDIYLYVIVHEQAHLQRLDHCWKPLGFVLLAVYWFNPLIWVSYILLCRDIELACDEKVIRTMGMREKKAYSEALLSCSVAAPVISACPLSFGEVGVKARVKAILRYKKPAFWVVLTATVIGLMLAVCFLTDPPENFTENVEPDPTPSPQTNITSLPDVDNQETVDSSENEQENVDGSENESNMFASEESFSSALLNSYIADGYTALSYEDYAAQYTVKLLSLPNLPEGYKNSGYVLVRPDPGMPDHIIIGQFWYNYDLQAEVVMYQDDSYSTQPISFLYTSHDEMGRSLGSYYWMRYRAVHIGSLNGKYYDLLLFTTQNLGEDYCRNILVVADP